MPWERIRRFAGVEAEEVGPAAWAFLYFFFLLSGYYVLRPLREEMGLAGGVRNLPWMFQATLVSTLLLTPLFGWCVQRFPREQMLPITYRFFVVQLLLFWVALQRAEGGVEVWLGRGFYVWLSVFNLFVVSIFWAVMADGFVLERSKRLFGLIAAGGSLGAIAGAALTAQLVEVVGRVHLLLGAAFLLELSVQAFRRLHRRLDNLHALERAIPLREVARERESDRAAWSGPFGGALNGIGQFFRSPYLLGIGLFLGLYSLGSTFLYFEQAHIVADAVIDRAARAGLFARIDLWVNLLTLGLQLGSSGRILRHFGVGPTLVILPLISVAGFGALAVAPVLTVLVVFQVLRRAGNYALIRPARETLFVPVRREERYKAKSFIDTFVYRGGDSLGSLAFDALVRTGWTMGPIAVLAAAISALWGGIGIWLGRQQSRRANAERATVPLESVDAPLVEGA